MRNIFVDQCIPTDVAEALGQMGFKVIRARDKGLSKASDEEIFGFSLKNSCLLLTFDKDFGNIIRFNIRRSQGVIIVYVEGLSKEKILQNITSFFQRIKSENLKTKGTLFIIEPDGIRIWPK